MLGARVYNSAGELVKLIYSGAATGVPTSVDSDRQLLWPGGAPLQLLLGGITLQGGLPALWGGLNDQGQAVSAGTYSIKVETVDAYGAVSVQIVMVQVLPPASGWTLKVMNSAGELVAELPLGSLSAAPTDLSPSSPVFAVDAANAGGPGQALKFDVRLADGNSQRPQWNGLNQDGKPVDSGIYYVALHSSSGGGAFTVTRTIQVIKAGQAAMPELAAFSLPASKGGGIRILAKGSLGPGESLAASLWNLAAEKVGQAQAPAGQAELRFESGRLSSGIYVVVVEISGPGARPARKILKVALVQ